MGTNLKIVDDISKKYGVDAETFEIIVRKAVMPSNHSKEEFLQCCMVAYEHNLNPITKEIYFMKTKAGTIQPIVGVDGWIKKCNEHPQFDGMTFDDHFEGKELVSVTCHIHRKDRKYPTAITEYLSECKTGSGPWKSHPSRMLRHRALIQCARIAFGFAGIMDPDEYAQWQGDIKDITPASSPPEIPDITEIPDSEPVPDIPDEDTLADADGLLEQIRSDVANADGDKGILSEILEQYEDLIPRLPEYHKEKAEKLFGLDKAA